MLIYKSFFRKKTTKTYFIIYSLIVLVIGLLLSTKSILESKEKTLYYGSYILVNTNNINELEKLPDIDKIYETIPIKVNGYYEIVLIHDDKYNVNGNHVIIPIINKDEYKIKDKIFVDIDGKQVELIIDGYDYINGNNEILYTSNDIINKYTKNSSKSYLLMLKNWGKYNIVLKKLNKIKDINDIKIRSYSVNDSLNTFITIVNIMLLVLIILFMIVLVITSINIIDDENKKNIIYSKIGYNKHKLKICNLVKIIMLILFSSIVSVNLTIIINIIYRLFVK